VPYRTIQTLTEEGHSWILYTTVAARMLPERVHHDAKMLAHPFTIRGRLEHHPRRRELHPKDAAPAGRHRPEIQGFDRAPAALFTATDRYIYPPLAKPVSK
jgi:hypothetical protein